jgi:hypothetical protein
VRLLLVEDKADFAADIERAVRPIPDCELVWAASRDSALEKLTDQHSIWWLWTGEFPQQIEFWTIIKSMGGEYFNS